MKLKVYPVASACTGLHQKQLRNANQLPQKASAIPSMRYFCIKTSILNKSELPKLVTYLCSSAADFPQKTSLWCRAHWRYNTEENFHFWQFKAKLCGLEG